jgi:hypothetical protein
MNLDLNYDDFLGLREYDFSSSRLIAFSGVSGSGKSTAIEYLLTKHPNLNAIDYETIDSTPIHWKKSYAQRWLVIDEIISLSDTFHLFRLLCKGHRIIVASHVSPGLLKFILCWTKAHFFQTDEEMEKLLRYLQKRNIYCSEETMEKFCRQYRSNYIDLDIILEHVSGVDFDIIYKQFQRHHSIST